VNIILLLENTSGRFFCTPKDKITHCVKEILNDGDRDGNGDKNSGDGVGDGDTFCGDREGTGTQPVGTWRGWGLTQWGRGGMGIGTTGTVGMGTNSCPRAALYT